MYFNYLSICGNLEYHGVGSSLSVKCNSKVVTVCASHRTLPIFRALTDAIDPWLLAVEPLSLDPDEEVEFKLELDECKSLRWVRWLAFAEAVDEFWPEELLLPLSKLMRINAPRIPHGSVSAIRMISRATRVRRSGGRSTSPHPKCTFLAALRHCSKWRDTERTVADSSGDSES